MLGLNCSTPSLSTKYLDRYNMLEKLHWIWKLELTCNSLCFLKLSIWCLPNESVTNKPSVLHLQRQRIINNYWLMHLIHVLKIFSQVQSAQMRFLISQPLWNISCGVILCIDLTQYVRIQFFAFDLNKIMSWMWKLRITSGPLLQETLEIQGLSVINAAWRQRRGEQKNQLACCPACWGKNPCVCKLIYTVTALLSTNFVAECIISTHWRGVVHLQGCNQLLPNFVSQKLSRKLVHITSGLLFALCWPFFRCLPSAIFSSFIFFSGKKKFGLFCITYRVLYSQFLQCIPQE